MEGTPGLNLPLHIMLTPHSIHGPFLESPKPPYRLIFVIQPAGPSQFIIPKKAFILYIPIGVIGGPFPFFFPIKQPSGILQSAL